MNYDPNEKPDAGLILATPTDGKTTAAADEAAELYARYRHPLDVEQRRTLDLALAERSDGTWAATEVADFKARQCGKGDSIEARELAGLLLFGEKLILHTCHEFATANEAFLRMASLFENNDDLKSLVARVRYANGEQGIELLSGARLKYKARSGGAGRGFAGADLVVLDEAQHLKAEHVAAIAPTITANPNAQIWVAGSGGVQGSLVAWKYRRRALSGERGRFAYTERTAEQVVTDDDGSRTVTPEIIDPLDHDLLMRAHPGYAAGRVSKESLATLLGSMGYDLFLRECLCIWVPEPFSGAVEGAIPLSVWADLIDATSTPLAGKSRLALDISADRTWTSVCLAGERADGLIHVEVTKSFPDMPRGIAFAAQAAAKLGVSVVVSASAQLTEPLRNAGVHVVEMKAAEQAGACSAMIDATRGEAPMIRHRGDTQLTKALALAETKPYGDAGMVWVRRGVDGDISPLTAVSMAVGALSQRRTSAYENDDGLMMV